MPVDLSLVLTYGAIFLSNAFFHSSRVGLTPKRVFFLVVAKGIVTIVLVLRNVNQQTPGLEQVLLT